MIRQIFKLILAVFAAILMNILAISQAAEQTFSSANTPKQPAYAQIDKAHELAVVVLARSGRKNVTLGEIRDLGAVHVVRVMDISKKNVLLNELFIRKDGAIMPVYGAPINGRLKRGERIENVDAARGLAVFWLWRTGQKMLMAGSVQQTELTYIVNLNPKGQPTVLVNQLIIRKNGLILPLGNGKSAMMLCIGCGGPGGLGNSFGWLNNVMLTQFDTDLNGWGSDWDAGWWGSGWGWGWGSSDNWTPPSNHGNNDCEGLTPSQCRCFRSCDFECREKDPDTKCFENCADICDLCC